MNRAQSRRKFIYKTLSASTVFLGAGLILGSCDSKKTAQQNLENTKPADPCEDLSAVSDSDKEKREKLGYVRESPIAESHCGNCNLYLPPGDDKACGGCLLFKGPVYAAGYCTYWAPQV